MQNFQDLRAMSMTKNESTQAAIPHQGIRILSCRVQFSLPRGMDVQKKSRREIEHSRRSHGNARAIESLRGVRMSLVPRPNNGEYLLP
jgi:hypothetical protein